MLKRGAPCSFDLPQKSSRTLNPLPQGPGTEILSGLIGLLEYNVAHLRDTAIRGGQQGLFPRGVLSSECTGK